MKNRIRSCFQKLQKKNKKAFVVYLCAGDPNLDKTVALVLELEKAGVDIIELGIPYSDPMADGPANQAAAERALAAGTTVSGVLDAVRKIREHSQIPILFFTYLNPIMAYGYDRFAADAVAAGADGVLPLDLPPEEDKALLTALRKAGLATVCLSAPNTNAERRAYLAKHSRGFLYYVCRLGVTGERNELPNDLADKVKALKSANDIPVCIGFGISTPEQAAAAAQFGDGVIIGSHLVRMVETHGADEDLVERLGARARLLAEAVHGV